MGITQSLFGGGNQELLGLDISSSAVKLLELSRRGERYQVEAYAVETLPANSIADKQISDIDAVGEAIGRAVSRAGTRTRQVAVAVSGSSVITKLIAMPASLSEMDMEEQIKVEADQYIPYPIDEVNIDFQILGPTDGGGGTVDVLLAACRKEQIETLSAALAIAGLTPKVVDVESYAMENACQFLTHQMPNRGQGRTVAVVDMGATTTSVIVLHDLHTIYTRDQAFGGKQLTEDVMRNYGMVFDEAAKAKRFGNLPESYFTEVLPSFIGDMAQQIDRSLQFFFASSSQFNSIDQIILAGGCAQVPDVDKALEERLHIPTAVATPFSQMTIAARAKPATLAKDESSLLIACGLAFRAFDPPV
ncbi:MAG: pilus assembly protein PilM [Pseudomonadota bacterium]|nr:pilus assembly protein PilM [Pseudomonadota bacterium]